MSETAGDRQLVFRGYTRAALDAEYNNQRKLGAGAFATLVERCRTASARTRQERHCVLDVRYGGGASETLDIFPAAVADAPVEVFFHGGYWRMLDKSDFSYVANGLLPHQRTLVVVNYGLIPAVTMDQLIDQCRRALVWVAQNIRAFGGDPENLHISGHSAGGHIAAMLLATSWREYGAAGLSSVVRRTCAISGIYDLEPVRLSYLNDTLKLDEETARRNSPLLRRRLCASKLYLAVGGNEGEEYLRQSTELATAWSLAGNDPTVSVFAGDDHFSIREKLGDPESDLVRLMLDISPLGGAGSP